MKIEKYNQRILAVIGTLIIIFLIVALISFIIITITEHNRFDRNDKGILSDEKIEQLQKENKRKQVISYETPILIDTLNLNYIIPVSHKTLDKEEDINKVLDFSSPPNYEMLDNKYPPEFYGEFNNIIIYKPKEGVKKKLFDKRANFNEIKTKYFNNDILLLIKVSEKDSYKDGLINIDDFKSLYVYSFAQSKLKRVAIENMDVYDYEFMHNTKDLIIEFGVDKNKNGTYEAYSEPTILKLYNFKTGKLEDIIDKKMNSTLQKTLERTKK